jgi:aldehyde dehydrogenase (NAD+)
MAQRTPNRDSYEAIEQRHQDTAAKVVPDNPRMYIGGNWEESISKKTFVTIDPTTQNELAEIPSGTSEDVDKAVAAAWEAYDQYWSRTDPTDRQQVLLDIAQKVEAHKDELATLETLDNGKPITESRIDIESVIDHFKYFAGGARTSGGKTAPSDEQSHIETVQEPFGVVGLIVPWNFPLSIASWKLAPAVAAGNSVVLKPAEQTSLSMIRFVQLINDVVPPGVINVVTGFGPEAGKPIVQHPDVPKISFTGSTSVGKEIMKDAAEHVKDITLELGGKNPIIIFPDADVQQAAQTVKGAIFSNTGEICTAGSRVFVHSEIENEFVSKFVELAETIKIGDPLVDETEMGPKISREQAQQSLDYIDLAEELGGDCITGGGPPEDEALSRGNYILPTIFRGVDHDSAPTQDEIFGPVELLFSWSDYESMMQLANGIEYGLAAGVLTENINRARKSASDLKAGTVWVNQYGDFPAGMPFGGYKQSGIGRETTVETMKEYTHTKAINYSYQ